MVGAAVALIAAATAAVLAVPRWLAPEDPLTRCAAISVLNGDYPGRADEAARLYRAGVAREVWLTADPRSGTSGADAGTASNARYLEQHGVPRDAVHVVPGTAIGTRAELAAIRSEAARRSSSCIIAVTSPLHARRVKVTWDRGQSAVPGTDRSMAAAPQLVVRHTADAAYAGWRIAAQEFALSVGALVGFAR